MTVPEKLHALRREMAEKSISYYLISTSDFHGSEYVGDYFKARAWLSGFTGSNGNLLVASDEAGLWTDARYFLQAEKQLENSGITLYKMGEEGVPTIREYLSSHLKAGDVLGFDGRTFDFTTGDDFLTLCREKGAAIAVDEDLVDFIWPDRPALPENPVKILNLNYSGKAATEKIADVRKKMAEKGADLHLLSSLDDIAWLLNVRGGDVSYVPVVLSYLALTSGKCIWFVSPSLLTDEVKAYLSEIGVEAVAYSSFYTYLSTLADGTAVLLDQSVANYRMVSALSKCRLINDTNPTTTMKAIKNETEMQNTRVAHLKDGVAVCRFMYWLKTNIARLPMTEISASDKLEALRREDGHFLDLSFDTICGYAAHGAIVHYGATPESDIPLDSEGLVLVDSGAHYLEGTTDITRTFALGPLTQEMKDDFTRVLIANLELANVRFLYGVTGMNLDILARAPFWEVNADFKHGTGHGVGHILSVHEGPNGFRWRQSPGRHEQSVLEEGMVTTDEPGLYRAGQYGIRTENELLCRKGIKNEFGQFMYFENLTYVPIDLDAINPDMLSRKNKEQLNAYHAMVYERVSPFLNTEEAAFLKKYTRAI